jgi:hypothetical protein
MLEFFRILVIAMLCIHGLLHGIWFLASWTSIRTGFRDGAWVLPGEFSIRSPLGKLWGLGALVVLALFSLGAIGLVAGDPGWTNVTNLRVFLSFGVVVPWWRQSPGSVGVSAVITDLVIMFLLALPLAEDITNLA